MSSSILLDSYIKLLLNENNKYNLTGLTSYNDVKSVLIDDVINNIDTFDQYNYIIDIGSGNGSFSIPLSIVNSNIMIYSIDPNNKKISFQKLCIDRFDLHNIQLIRGRFNEILRISSLDMVCVRALYHINILCELLTNYMRVGGIIHVFSNHIPDNNHILSTGLSIFNTIPISNGNLYLLKKDKYIADYKPRKLKYLQNIFK